MRFILFLLILSCIACTQHQSAQNRLQDSVLVAIPDTAKRDSIFATNPDTDELNEYEPDYRKEYIAEYDQQLFIDTPLYKGGKAYRVLAHHYCTRDSAVVVPAKYNFDTNKDFITHNFKTDLLA